MKRKVWATMTECFELIDRKLLNGPWVMAEQYTICGPRMAAGYSGRAVTRRHIYRQDVGEFGQIGLAEDYRTVPAQEFDHLCVPIGLRIGESQRAGCRMLGIDCCVARGFRWEDDRDENPASRRTP